MVAWGGDGAFFYRWCYISISWTPVRTWKLQVSETDLEQDVVQHYISIEWK